MIKNLPRYAEDMQFIVTREVEGEYWFWGAYEDSSTAHKAANEIGGMVIEQDV